MTPHEAKLVESYKDGWHDAYSGNNETWDMKYREEYKEAYNKGWMSQHGGKYEPLPSDRIILKFLL